MIDEKKLQHIHQIARMYAESLVLYGVNLENKYETATEMSLALENAYLRGSEDALKDMDSCDHDCKNCWKFKLLKSDWIPFKEKEADAEERAYYGVDAMLDCKLPDEDEDILVTYASGRVGLDTFLREGYECYLDSGAEFISEAVAWMPMPESYNPNDETKIEDRPYDHVWDMYYDEFEDA